MSAAHTSGEREYLSCADTAKLVRKALRQNFPEVKFTVRSSTYAGGASISVGWMDGPVAEDVDAILGLYQGASFDGMIDLKSYHDSLLANEDGSVRHVHFGADFIHSQRRISDARRRLHRHEVERFLGRKFEDSERLPVSACTQRGEFRGHLARDEQRGEWASTTVEMLGHLRPWHGEPCPGGDGSYCPSCGRYQADHRAPHLW